ncbi:flagellar brake domain-containing protein [Halanaerocella petrolearia]
MSSKLYVCQYVHLSRIDQEDDYKARIIDLKKDEIRLHSESDLTELTAENQLLTLSFIDNNALYRLRVVVKEVKEKYLLVTVESGIERVQRRRYVRVPIYKKIEYKLIDNKGDDFKEAIALDISGGGLKVMTKELDGINIEAELEIKLDSFSLEFNIVEGRLVRVQAEDDSESEEKVYYLGIEFVDLPKAWREDIIEWVFAKQRELKIKGKL